MSSPLKVTSWVFTVLIISRVVSEDKKEITSHSFPLYNVTPHSTYALISYPPLRNLLSGRISFVSQRNFSRLEGMKISFFTDCEMHF